MLPPKPLALTVLLGVLVAAAAIECAGLGVPVTGARDTQSASIARHLGEDGWKGLLFPRGDFSADGRGTVLMEFPLVSALGAALRGAVPAAGEAAYKIPSMLFGALALLSLFAIARRLAGDTAALLAAALLAFSPLHLEISVSPRPDEGALALALAGFALRERHRRLAAAAVALALLAKTTYAFVLVPWVLLDVAEDGIRSVVRPGRLAEIAAIGLPVVLWHAHAANVNAESYLMGNLTVAEAAANYAWQKGRVGFFVRPDWYARIGERVVAAATPAGALLALAGVFSLRGRRAAGRVVVALGAGVATLLVLFPWHSYDHHYYVAFAVPLTALLGALAFDAARRWVPERLGPFAAVGAVSIVAAIGPPSALLGIRSVNGLAVAFSEAVRKVVPDGRLVIVSAPVIGPWDASLLYRSERRGWRYSTRTLDESDATAMAHLARAKSERGVIVPGRRRVPYSVSRDHLLSPESIERLRERGAAFFAYAGPLERLRDEKPTVAEHLIQGYGLVLSIETATIFDLRR